MVEPYLEASRRNHEPDVPNRAARVHCVHDQRRRQHPNIPGQPYGIRAQARSRRAHVQRSHETAEQGGFDPDHVESGPDRLMRVAPRRRPRGSPPGPTFCVVATSIRADSGCRVGYHGHDRVRPRCPRGIGVEPPCLPKTGGAHRYPGQGDLMVSIEAHTTNKGERRYAV